MTLLGLEMLLVAIVDERVEIGDSLDHDIAAAPAIAAGWAAAGNKLLPPKGDATIAAIPGLHANCGLIDEHDVFATNRMCPL